METVRFVIYRKPAFAGALLPYGIYINSQFVGTIKNGKTLNVSVPKADVYYLTDNNFFEQNAVIYDRNVSEYRILLKRAGERRTDSYNEFYIDNGQQAVLLPSFHFEKLINAVYESHTDRLSSDERLLALCLEFWIGITDDIQEVLASERLPGMLDALQKIGAAQYADILLQIISELFSDVALPLDDGQMDQMQKRFIKANRMIRNNENSARTELHSAVVKHITSRLNNRENVY